LVEKLLTSSVFHWKKKREGGRIDFE